MHPLTEAAGWLLDMDGTVVDSHAVVERAWVAWAGRRQVLPQAVLAVCHGGDTESMIRRFRPDLDDAEVQRDADQHIADETGDVADVRPTRGAHDLIAWLEATGRPWGVVTNAPHGLAEARLGAAGVHPGVLVCRDDVPDGKPAPDGYLLAAERLGVDITACAAVEDSPSGLAAGRAAGAITVGVRGATDADWVFDAPADILAALVARP